MVRKARIQLASVMMSAALAVGTAPLLAGQAQKPASVATGEGEIDGLRVEVTELKRTTGDTLTLRFTLINESAPSFDFSDLADHNRDLSGEGHAIGGIHLLDPLGKKKYFVARDTAGKCVCSSRLVSLQRGQRVNLWAKFSAPPAEVEKLSIVLPKFIPIDDVPISK
jgi:hypothetical protein